MSNNLQNYMAINTEDGKIQEIMGKYMYYSLPKLIVKAERVKEICRQIGFPIEVNENISATDAFRSATGEIYDRIEETENGGVKTVKIYCRDNKRANTDVLSRELVEETLYETTNSYKKLANLSLDKTSGELILSDVDYSSERDIRGYFDKAQDLFQLYQNCIGNRSIETMADKYISGLCATAISARGHHYFIPKAYMHGITLLEDFMELVAKENLFTYANKRDSKYISINSMYVADDEKQRGKMAHEFYRDMGNEIETYQKRILNLIRNGSSSQKILDRWELKIQSLESKKREYEGILKQNLSGIDEEFTMLRDICDQFKFAVKRTQVLGLAA